jgi:hypothetical protein
VEEGLTRFGPWRFLEIQAHSDGFRQEFMKEVTALHASLDKDVQPFAQNADDIAGFIIRNGEVTEEVLCVHLTFSGRNEVPGFPGMQHYDDIWAWLAECVLEEMRSLAPLIEQGRKEGLTS